MNEANVIEFPRSAAERTATPPLLSAADLLLLRQSMALVEEKVANNSHTEFLRENGMTCVSILEPVLPDPDTLAATMLLPAYESGLVDDELVAARINAAVARLLQGADRIAALKELRNAEVRPLQIDRLRHMLLTMAEDPRVVLMRLAYQLCALRAAKNANDSVRRQLGEETLAVFAPLANRLGVGQLKWELEDLAFRFVNPEAYCSIADKVSEKRVEREEFIKRVLNQLATELQRAGISGEVSGRPKHIYSIWRKTQRKQAGVEQIFDALGLRVVVTEVADCYAALGVVHSLWAPVPSEFDDYIARPKENNYQSLHTAVVGSEGRVMEVQIRTQAMHRNADLGIAAHWQYKERVPNWSSWSRRMLESAGAEKANSDLISRYRDIAFHDRIYVITPNGRIIDLPKGATALDFAYAVHTDIGHQCRGAKTGGSILPLTQPLASGATVEILTGREGGPSRDWLIPQNGYLTTPSARAKVRRWFRDKDRTEHIAQGRDLLDRELRRLGLADVKLSELAQTLQLANADELFAALGRGDLTTAQIALALQPAAPPPSEEVKLSPTPAAEMGDGEIMVLGVTDVMTRIARCCSPVPGEEIGGYITVGQGVSIHRANCGNFRQLCAARKERIVDVNWGDQSATNHRVNIEVEALDRRGLLRDVSDLLSSEKVDIVAVNTLSNEASGSAHMTFTVLVADLRQLEKILHRLLKLKDVRMARRRG
jgi:GTP pyrophosphokinase